jgi:hypothetical protein
VPDHRHQQVVPPQALQIQQPLKQDLILDAPDKPAKPFELFMKHQVRSFRVEGVKLSMVVSGLLLNTEKKS